jgi:hypothetical protein
MRYNYIKTVIIFLGLLANGSILLGSNGDHPIVHGSGHEVKSLRDRTAKHFVKGDGSFHAEIYAGSIHYFENNEWLDIDLTILKNEKLEGFPYSNTANSFQTYYPATFLDPILTVKNGFQMKERS